MGIFKEGEKVLQKQNEAENDLKKMKNWKMKNEKNESRNKAKLEEKILQRLS